MADDFVTREEYLALKRVIAKRLKKLDDLVSDAFQAISDLDNRITENVDEALDHAQRAERAVRRLKKVVDELE